MRIAVMSDIHGFNLALETVLADLDATGPYDEIVVAGDFCETGPAPGAVLERLRNRDVTVLQGNTDLDLVVAARQGDAEGATAFAIDEIGPNGVDFLAALPFSRRVTPPGGATPDDDLLVVHANPHNLTDKLDPEESDHDLRELIGDAIFSVIAFGHIHICYIRRLDRYLLVDVSAVGNPKDDDLRCKYGVMTWDEPSRTWDAKIRKLDYPLEATIDQIRDGGLPDPEKVIRQLIKASY